MTVIVPPAAIDGRRVTVRLPGRVGRDQIASALRDGGWNGFEPPMPTAFAACASAFPGVAYDIGANSGFYSAIAAKVARKNKVFAFEPFPPLHRNLGSTIRVNRCAARVAIEPLALGDSVGEATLYVPLQDHGLVETSCTLSPDFKDEYSDAISVQVLTVDAFSATRHPGRATVLKIDVESLEVNVLRGALHLLATDRPLVFCEVLPQGDAAGIDEIRQQLHYVDIQLHPSHAVIGEAVAFASEAWNHLLVPEEKLDLVRGLLARCGLGV